MSGQKKSEVKFAKEEATMDHRSQMILQTSMDGFCIMNLNGKPLYVNPALCKITGYTKQQLLDSEIKNLDAQKSPKQIARQIEKIKKKGFDRFQTLLRHKDKRILDIEISAQYCDFNKDKFIFFFVRDITAHKQAEKKLLESEKTHRTLCNNIPGMVYKARKDWSTEIVANSKQISGYDVEELNSKKILWPDLIAPEDRERILNEASELEKKTATIIQEYRIITKDGNIRWVEDHKTSRFTKAGFSGVDGIVFDMTDHRQIEKKLYESEQKYKSLVSSVPGLVYRCKADENWTMIYFSKETETITGYPVSDFIDNKVRTYASVIHPDDRAMVEEIVFDAVKKKKSYKLEYRIIHKNGEVKWILENGRGVFDKKGKLLYLDGVNVDITDRKKAEAERHFYKEKVLLAQKYAYIDSMGTIVAHQVNQPLTVINMLLANALEQLQDQSCPPSVIEEITQSLKEAKNAAAVIQKFRHSSRDTPSLKPKPKNLERTVNEIISVLTERAASAGINISSEGMHNLTDAEIDDAALEQIFFNLIQNAVEAADGKKQYKLNIFATSNDGKIELVFSDNCPGIAPEDLKKIFEPFYTTKKDGKGMGLGLEIVKHVLLGCGGEINVKSKLGKGTKFYITLPAENNENSYK